MVNRATRIGQIRKKVLRILKKYEAENKKRLKAGICRLCDKPIVGGNAAPFDSDHCAEHSREVELECLVEDQEEDNNAR